MGKQIRKCIVDKELYSFCPKCGGDNPKETWRLLYCCENCREIYETCRDYNDEKITIKSAYSKLSKLDLSKLNNFTEYVAKPTVEEILEKGKPTQRKKQTKKTTAKADNK